MNEDYKPYLAELIGTFALVFVGAGAGALGVGGLVGVALAHGLILAGMIYAFGHISGTHVNPAITLGLLAVRRIRPATAVGYIVAQLLGAALAGFFLSQILPGVPALGTAGLGTDVPIGDLVLNVSVVGGLLTEITLTFLLVTAVYGGAVDTRSPKGFAGLGIGLTLAALILMGGPLTGAALNPARAIGPALFSQGALDIVWLYIVGPVVGAVLATLLFESVLLTRGRPVEPTDEVARDTAPPRGAPPRPASRRRR